MSTPNYLIPFVENSDYDNIKTFYDFYSGVNNPKSISATTLLRPTQALALEYLHGKDLVQEDKNINAIYSSSIGEAIHQKIEECIKHSPHKIFKDNLAEILINPKTIDISKHNIIMEKRFTKVLNGVEINGKVDLILLDQLIDFKTTSVYTYIKQRNFKKYQLQGSIYRWIAPHIIKQNTIKICYIFTDWSNAGLFQNTNYPPTKILEQEIPLLTLEETENFISKKLEDLDYAIANPDNMSQCSLEDLWQDDDNYKVYKDQDSLNNNKRALKNFSDLNEANKFASEKSGRVLKIVKGMARACNYCPVKQQCMQYVALKNQGLIE